VLEWFGNSDLFRAGGWVLAFILALSVAMWALILERYLFLQRHLAGLVGATLQRLERQLTRDPRVNRRLRAGLERETNPVRQLTLLHQFVKGAAAESPEVRRGFELLKREAAAAGPKVVSEFILPLLTGRRRR